MHTLCFLDPGHFHAALTLRAPHASVAEEIFVYASDGPELAEFLKLIDAFNRRSERPTKWRPVVRSGQPSLERLLAERPGDVAILAGRNDGKLGAMRRLHDGGFHVLADKPWLTRPEAIDDARRVLASAPVAFEIMTGRHEITSILAERVVRDRRVFGEFDAGVEAAIRLTSVHHLEKTVNGAPLRRPPWYFDVRVQGTGLADIPTHLVAEAQRLLGAHGDPARRELELVEARLTATSVPVALFRRVTGLAEFPAELAARVDDERLAYFGNAELAFRLRGVGVAVSTRWDLAPPPEGGDTHSALVAGTRARLRIEQGLHTGFRRRVFVEPRGDAASVQPALDDLVAGAQAQFPGLAVGPAPRGFELRIPAALHTGHETHFPLVLDECLRTIDAGGYPDDRAAETLAKYELLARALASARDAA
jgi:predicted dehydrogenase